MGPQASLEGPGFFFFFKYKIITSNTELSEDLGKGLWPMQVTGPKT